MPDERWSTLKSRRCLNSPVTHFAVFAVFTEINNLFAFFTHRMQNIWSHPLGIINLHIFEKCWITISNALFKVTNLRKELTLLVEICYNLFSKFECYLWQWCEPTSNFLLFPQNVEPRIEFNQCEFKRMALITITFYTLVTLLTIVIFMTSELTSGS